MELQTFQLMAGGISSFLFISGNLPMLVKAYKTRNLRSYSLSNMVLVNAGNLMYWLYISNLPFGPIWVLHTFYTLAQILMLVWYLRYEFSRTHDRATVPSPEPLPAPRRGRAPYLLTLPLLERVYSACRSKTRQQ